MKIISWNVNGLRASIKKGLFDYIEKENADIFHMQEIKIAQDDLEKLLQKFPKKYECYYHCASEKRGYSGVLTLTKKTPNKAIYGLGIEQYDTEGRILTLEFDYFTTVNVYFPHTGRKLERLNFKMNFSNAFYNYVTRIVKPTILSGDFNVAHTEKDIARAKENEGNAGFTKEEREYFTKLLKGGYLDTFRHIFPEKIQYTWWLQNFNARSRNIGWRIDYNLVDNILANKILSASVHDQILGSDHCPVSVNLDIL